MGTFKPTNYINIQGWMITELKLSSNDLIVYAIIYGMSQNEESEFNGSLAYMESACGCAKRTIQRVLERLVDENLIIRRETVINNVMFPSYRHNPAKVPQGYGQNVHPHDNDDNRCGQNDIGGGVKMSTNNKSINNKKENINKRKVEPVSKNPPSFDEFKSYIDEKNLNVDAEYQYKYWSEGGWLDYFGNEMYNWKGQLLTKSRNNDKYKPRLEGMKTETDDRQLRDIKEWQKANEEKDDLPF